MGDSSQHVSQRFQSLLRKGACAPQLCFPIVLLLRAGQQLSKVRSEDRMRVNGVNGQVNKVSFRQGKFAFRKLVVRLTILSVPVVAPPCDGMLVRSENHSAPGRRRLDPQHEQQNKRSQVRPNRTPSSARRILSKLLLEDWLRFPGEARRNSR